MANKNRKFDKNVPGKYYVDESCIGCMLCSQIAPDNFAINTDENLPVINDYVYQQPRDECEEALCAEAMDICPAGAIGDDG